MVFTSGGGAPGPDVLVPEGLGDGEGLGVPAQPARSVAASALTVANEQIRFGVFMMHSHFARR